MDNADDLPLAESFLPSQPLGHVVFTTQSQIIGTTATPDRQIEIEELGLVEGWLLLLRRSGILLDEASLDSVATDIRAAALQLVELLGGLPLALDQAGAYIAETGASLTDYIQLYENEHRYLLTRRGSPKVTHKHPESIAATIYLSLNKVIEQNQTAAEVLFFCSFLPPHAMQDEVLYLDDGLGLDIKTLNEVIAVLQGYSLIKRNVQDKMLSMHSLLQDLVVGSQPPKVTLNFAVRSMFARHIWLANELLKHAYLDESPDKYERVKGQFQQNLGLYEGNYGANHQRTQNIKKEYANFLHSLGHDAKVAALDVSDEPSE